MGRRWGWYLHVVAGFVEGGDHAFENSVHLLHAGELGAAVVVDCALVDEGAAGLAGAVMELGEAEVAFVGHLVVRLRGRSWIRGEVVELEDGCCARIRP